jgi:hypothetical protein
MGGFLERSNNEQKTVVLITTNPTLVELFCWLGEGVRWIVVASVEALLARPYPMDLILWQGDSDGQCVPSELFSYQVPVVALVAQGQGAHQRLGEGCPDTEQMPDYRLVAPFDVEEAQMLFRSWLRR